MLSFIALAILIIGIGSYFGHNNLPSVSPARAASRTISLVGTYPTWNSSDPTIIVTKGDSITIVVSTTDSFSHQLLIDFDGDGVSDVGDCGTTDQCSGSVTSTMSSTISPFPVNTSGNFSYYCTIHHPPYMTGIFRVQNPAPPPSPDFSLSANPSSLSIVQGANANSTITVSSINNFMGGISLSASSNPTGPTFSFQPNSVTVSPPSAASKLTISIPSTTATGSYTVTVNGMNSTTTRSTSLAVTVTAPPVPDFSISSNHGTITVSGSGWTVTTSVALNSLNGFSGTVNLSASVSPSGPQVAINPATVTLAAGGSATLVLTIKAPNSGGYSSPAPPGSYMVTVNATSSSLSHSTTVPFTVESPSPSGISSLTVELIVGGAIAAVVIVGAVVFLIRSRPTGMS